MKFWKRQATLQIGSKRFGMDDLYFKFTVPFEDSEKLGTATIEAYNLSPATRNSIKKGMPIILNAGYEGDIGAIFTGKVSQVSDKHSGTEVITTIAAAEALEEWLSKEVNKTYTAGSKASAIVKDLLNIFGLEVGTMELAVDKEYPRGKVCKGKVKNVLTEIVTSDCKSRFLIRNGIVTINGVKADKTEFVSFSIPATGWKTDSSVPGYTNYIDIAISGLTAADYVAVDVAPSSSAVARAANFVATESRAGILRLRAASVPTATISAQYHIITAATAAKEG